MAPSVGACWASHKRPIVPGSGGLAGPAGLLAGARAPGQQRLRGVPHPGTLRSRQWERAGPLWPGPASPGPASPGPASPGPAPPGPAPPGQAPPGPCPRTAAASLLPPAMEEDVPAHRSRLPVPGGPTSPSRIPGPPPRRDSLLGAPSTPTKRSCLSVTLRRGCGGPPWERLRSPAVVTPVPPRPRPLTTEGPQRCGGPGGAEAALAVRMGVPSSPPHSGGSLLRG
ncbi:basic proline-rich protein-like [Melanerpes formicivorus]|uniref:basic proline-rich protein-like n=1 Tax=Melanerpes formicivorus TaxID=211600 RepID=UPI00358E961E